MIPPRRFELPDDWERVPGLIDRIQDLVTAGRYRTALDVLLAHLRRDAASVDALALAAVTMSGSRTERVESPEPPMPIQENSALFAPITTVCSVCTGSWFSTHTLHRTEQWSIVNPIGLQCQVCRHTICKNCRPWTANEGLSRPCPEPGCKGTVTAPVLPTGRDDVEPVDPMTIENVVVIRAGPITPTVDEAMTVVTKFVPILRSDTSMVSIRPSAPHIMDRTFSRNLYAVSVLEGLERERVLERGSWSRATPLFIEAGAADDADYLLVVVRWPGVPKKVVHVHVMREGSEHMSADYIHMLLEVMAPRAFTDHATITGTPGGDWPEDPRFMILLLVNRNHPEYLSDDFVVRTQFGQGPDGLRYVLAAVSPA
ncbi:hypothetical protein GCM10023201_33070 [Actinomycetospora corticicola]|uniref:Uncharacterized protein n=1 Tax=Actinomycetospora corticicola TaxID=663602 RepID=A0A7Y9J3Y7_9PSEU|nr:hypothetical protein [Actinomycetospora corticicola]NYD34568.1 hypothetical protein [Actinomycetospora corticicola]